MSLRDAIVAALDRDHEDSGFTLGRVESAENRRIAALVLVTVHAHLSDHRALWRGETWHVGRFQASSDKRGIYYDARLVLADEGNAS